MEVEAPTAGEIEEATHNDDVEITTDPDESLPLLPTKRSVRTKVPEVEVHLYRRGTGPIDVFKSALGGWEQDQIEIGGILDKYGFKSVFAFNPESGRGVPIRFHPKNGRSLLPYADGSVIFIDGEPKDSLLKPITKILLGVAVITFMIVFVMKESPEWMQKLSLYGGRVPPWILACVVIVFTRLRKRTRDFLEKRGVRWFRR
ncbi:uncharacterized protein LOC131329361 isoform X2 [Rhododendron vialii]|uniref:uncharacterized protein LOC131329361 isoform X2 n=1 Tax=Rhododendron vialii TaxID=182163 RepID=UPI00265EBE0E|nr:uncharacterized protein LOC131329361 isoform X2 [Rhododendron vialii]